VSSKNPSEPLDLARGIPTPPRDVEALHALRHPRCDDETYLRMLMTQSPATQEELRARPGPARGEPFRLD
jgi:hypothetical protein